MREFGAFARPAAAAAGGDAPCGAAAGADWKLPQFGCSRPVPSRLRAADAPPASPYVTPSTHVILSCGLPWSEGRNAVSGSAHIAHELIQSNALYRYNFSQESFSLQTLLKNFRHSPRSAFEYWKPLWKWMEQHLDAISARILDSRLGGVAPSCRANAASHSAASLTANWRAAAIASGRILRMMSAALRPAQEYEGRSEAEVFGRQCVSTRGDPITGSPGQ